MPAPVLLTPTDPESADVSPDAVQLAQTLSLTVSLKRIEDLRRQIGQTKDLSLPRNLRQDFAEAKLEAIETIEQTRLEIDFVSAEIEEELAGYQELLQSYSTRRNEQVNRINAYSFRVNGALWAVAEALDIPTYNHPRYSISSGTVGILAGLVPSAFSLYALRAPESHYSRMSYPNMLSKLFGYETIPRIRYPASVWSYLNAKPPESSKSRLDIMIEHWHQDKYIVSLRKSDQTAALNALTGYRQDEVTIDLLADRLTMLRITKAVVMQMNRPLLELSMIVRGSKRFGQVSGS